MSRSAESRENYFRSTGEWGGREHFIRRIDYNMYIYSMACIYLLEGPIDALSTAVVIVRPTGVIAPLGAGVVVRVGGADRL